MVKKRIAFCTGTRAEYGLLKPLMDLVLADKELDFELYVTGMHLSHEFGHTIDLIEQDGIPVTEQVEILLSGDTSSAISKSMGLAMIGFGEVFSRRKPDVLVLLGDRFETFCVAAAATVACIPIAHLYGGELTLGAIDDTFRHSITKMSYLHFTSTEEYRKRVIQLGEDPSRVFTVGAIGVENISTLPLMDKDELQDSLGIKLGKRFALVTFHPATIESLSPENQVNELLKALDSFPDLFIVFTKANADAGGRVINTLIDNFVALNKNRAVAFTSMGQLRYLSAIKLCSVVIGNSSSGIIEAPSFNVPTVNIGSRQDGRVRASSVIDCVVFSTHIEKSINTALLNKKNTVLNPYYSANTSSNIFTLLKQALIQDFKTKTFYDQ